MNVCFLGKKNDSNLLHVVLINSVISPLVSSALCSLNIAEFGLEYVSINQLKEKKIIYLEEGVFNETELSSFGLNNIVLYTKNLFNNEVGNARLALLKQINSGTCKQSKNLLMCLIENLDTSKDVLLIFVEILKKVHYLKVSEKIEIIKKFICVEFNDLQSIKKCVDMIMNLDSEEFNFKCHGNFFVFLTYIKDRKDREERVSLCVDIANNKIEENGSLKCTALFNLIELPQDKFEYVKSEFNKQNSLMFNDAYVYCNLFELEMNKYNYDDWKDHITTFLEIGRMCYQRNLLKDDSVSEVINLIIESPCNNKLNLIDECNIIINECCCSSYEHVVKRFIINRKDDNNFIDEVLSLYEFFEKYEYEYDNLEKIIEVLSVVQVKNIDIFKKITDDIFCKFIILKECKLHLLNIFFDKCISLCEERCIKLFDNVQWFLIAFDNVFNQIYFGYFLKMSEIEIEKMRLLISFFDENNVEISIANKQLLIMCIDPTHSMSFEFIEDNKDIFKKFNFEFANALSVLFFSYGVKPLANLLAFESKTMVNGYEAYKNIAESIVIDAFRDSVVYLNNIYSGFATIDDELVRENKLKSFRTSVNKCIEILEFLYQGNLDNDVCQDFLMLKILVDSYDNANPKDQIAILRKHIEWSNLNKLPLYNKFLSVGYNINFSNIKLNMQKQLTIVDLPIIVTKEKFDCILDKLKIYINGEIQEKDRAFLGMIFPKRSIEDINKLIGSFKLNQYLLSFFNANCVTEIRYKWYKIIENMINAKICKTEGFSEQEEIACGYINQIQMCNIGLNNGIEVAYSLLPVAGLLDADLSNKDDANALIYLTMIKNDPDFVDKINFKLDDYDNFWQLLDSNKLSKYISEVYLNEENLIPDKMRIMECDAHLLKDAI